MSLQLVIGAVIGAVAALFMVMAGLAFIEPGDYGVPPFLYLFLKDIVGPVAAGFGGAISGAFISYRYQQQNEERKLLSDEARSFNRAMALLAHKLNDIASIKNSAILPRQNDPVRFITIPPIAQSPSREERAAESLGEILIGRGLQDLLPDIFEAEELYHSVRESFYERATLISEMREKTEISVEGRGRVVSLDLLVNILGVGATVRMYHLTEQIITGIDDAIDGLIDSLMVVGERCGRKIKSDGGAVLIYGKDKNEAYTRTAAPFFRDADHLEQSITELAGFNNSHYAHKSHSTGYRYRPTAQQ